MEYTKNCPVCGYDLGFKPWHDGSASDEICPSCGIQFGNDDALGGNQEQRLPFYKGWRGKWRKDGCKWSSAIPVPENWNPEQQLKNIIE